MPRLRWCVLGVVAVFVPLLTASGCGGGRDAELPETPPERPKVAQPGTPPGGVALASKETSPEAKPSDAKPEALAFVPRTATAEPPRAATKVPPPPQASAKPAEQGPGELAPLRTAECRWRNGPIKIDGRINETAWDGAQTLDNFVVFWQKRKAKSATTARLLWDDKYLYFSAEMEDEDLYADVKEFNGMTWTNDVFELFFKPDKEKLLYYEFQVNPLNTQLELLLPSRGAGGYQRFGPLTRLGMETAVKLEGTLNKYTDKDTGWTVEGRIPWKAFAATGGRPLPGAKWRFALCRYDYSVAFDRPELSSTAPLTQPDFHRYEDYGELTFVGPKS